MNGGEPRQTCKYDASRPTSCVECCPYESAQDLILFATDSTIEVLKVSLEHGSEADHQPVFTNIQKLPIGSKVTALSWSPESLSRNTQGGYETKISFAASFQDWSIRFYASGCDPIDVCRMPQLRHQDVINDIAMDRVNGQFIASVSDDKTCRVWRVQDSSVERDDSFPIVMRLKSRGVSVNTNEKLASQILVGEACGAIRIMDIETQTWLFSVFHPDKSGPDTILRSMDWNALDPNLFGAVIGRRWYVWSLKGERAMHIPEHSGDAHSEIAHRFRWCLSDPKMFATSTNAPENFNTRRVALKIFSSVYNQMPNAISLSSKSRLTSISWLAFSKAVVGSTGNHVALWYVE